MLSALAIAAMVACSKDEVVRTPALSPILFKGAFVENATRADKATDPSTTTNSTNAITGFDVWGFMDEASGVVFTSEDVTGSKDAGWSYVNTQYWTIAHDYYFYALAPMNSKNVTVDVEDDDAEAKLGLGTVGFTNVDGTEDLLYAEADPAKTTTKGTDGANLPAVELSFNHLLSKVKFTFTNGFANNNISIKITNLKMTAPKAGSIDLTTATPDELSWTLTAGQENATTLAFNSGTETTELTGTVKVQECENERLTIPAGAEQVYEISFDVEMYNGDVKALSGTKTATVKGVALEIGKAYNFTTTLNASNITDSADEDLYPIEFTVVEVVDWEDAGEVVAVTADVATAEDLLAAVEAGGSYKLTADIETSVPFIVNKDVILDLGGKTITTSKGLYQQGVVSAPICVKGGTLTIKNGTVDAVANDDYAVEVRGGNLIIEGGTYKGSTTAVYALEGNIVIKGGKFSVGDGQETTFLLNLLDANYRNGTASISCEGGTYNGFNPADNAAENPAVDFVADGYKSVETAAGSGVWNVVAE